MYKQNYIYTYLQHKMNISITFSKQYQYKEILKYRVTPQKTEPTMFLIKLLILMFFSPFRI